MLAASNSLIIFFLNQELSYGWEHETVQVTRPASAVQVVELYLQALLERTICLETSSLMVKNGLLAALIQVSQMFDDQILKLLSVRIVANISTFDELHAHIFQSGNSGWIFDASSLITFSDRCRVDWFTCGITAM